MNDSSATEPWTPEAAFAELLTNIAALQGIANDSNEAETRLKLIDRLMFDILDWELADVEVERYCRAVGFSDYVFSIRGTIALVVEAKKSEVYFTLPANKFKPEPLCFALIEEECKAAGLALRQALGYAASLGCRYAAITNGHQWLIALTFVQSQSIEERQVILFDSIESIKSHFRRFWTCFSKQAIASNSLLPLLLESRKKPAPAKPSATVPGYPVQSQRNRIVNELSYILNVVWDVLARTENTDIFLQSCYVAPTANEHLLAFAKDILKRRLAADKISRQSDVSPASPEHFRSTIIGYENEKPFVILGEVGHGKTTFLNNLRYVVAKDLFESYIQLEVDFKDRPDGHLEVNDFIYKEIELKLLERHGIDIYADQMVRGALYTQLARFRHSSQYVNAGSEESKAAAEVAYIQEQIRDRHAYFKSMFKHLKRGREKSIAVFVDNLDRRDIRIQEAAFLKASAIARDWECVTFICLRPSTFYQSLRSGLLDSLAPKTFAVGSPDLALVMKRRFQFAAKLALGEVDSAILQNANMDKAICFKLPTAAQFFSCCEFSVFKGSDSIAMLSALSNGNIRLLLDLAKTMITSGHLDTGKIVSQIQQTGTYYVPDFETVKTLLYGDYDHYDPNCSLFVNLFDIYHTDPKEHFIRILILDYLNRFEDTGDGRGWISYQDLLTYLEAFYFDVATIQRHLKILVEGGCVTSDVGLLGGDAIVTKLRVSTRGRYHIANLAGEFQYLDAVTIDTPILDSSLRIHFRAGGDITERIERTRHFLAYLVQCADDVVDVEGRATVLQILQRGVSECNHVENRSKDRVAQRRTWRK